jgi:hypothetical protein
VLAPVLRWRSRVYRARGKTREHRTRSLRRELSRIGQARDEEFAQSGGPRLPPSDAEIRVIDELERLDADAFLFPAELSMVRPTRLGNILTASLYEAGSGSYSPLNQATGALLAPPRRTFAS